jgi:hypothetical protein
MTDSRPGFPDRDILAYSWVLGPDFFPEREKTRHSDKIDGVYFPVGK